VCSGAVFPHKIDLVLEDDDVVQLHDLNGCKMLASLWLRTRLVAGDEQQGGVHDGSARQHRAHENVVARTVDKRNVAFQPVFAPTAFTLARRVNLLLALVRPVACWARALGIVTLVDLCVGVTELDGDIPLEFVLETDSLDPGNGLDDGALSVGDVANRADVDGGLTGDDLRRQRVEFRQVY
jgi:hypothetical protein